jgi:hypothetical protein
MNRRACHRRGLTAALHVARSIARRARPIAGAAALAIGLSGNLNALAADLGVDAAQPSDLSASDASPGDAALAFDLRGPVDLYDGGPGWYDGGGQDALGPYEAVPDLQPAYPSEPTGSYYRNSNEGCAWGPPAPLPFAFAVEERAS